jgi:hypothetical protein
VGSQRDTSCDKEEIERILSGSIYLIILIDLPQPSRLYGILMARLIVNMSLILD